MLRLRRAIRHPFALERPAARQGSAAGAQHLSYQGIVLALERVVAYTLRMAASGGPLSAE